MAMNRKNICDTKPTQLLREVGRKTLLLMFSYLDFRCYFKANAQTQIHFPP